MGMDWQPIATAPTDGSRILVGRAADASIGRHALVAEAWFNQGRWVHGPFHAPEPIGCPTDPITHWQPLPPPPDSPSERKR